MDTRVFMKPSTCASIVRVLSALRNGVTGPFSTPLLIVGKYAVQFLWSDTHFTGIYPFAMLRDLCTCEEHSG